MFLENFINMGHNPQMLEKSKNLGGYSIFIDKIREFTNNGATLEESLKGAVKYCLENNILSNFLEKYRSEVMDMILEDLTTEEWEEVIREEAFEIAREEERKEFARKMKARGRPLQEIVEDTELSPEEIEKL